MNNYITDYKKCTGCSACISICPQQCISMQRGELGFLYPYIDTQKCIDCKLCAKTCPVNEEIEEKQGFPECYGMYNKDDYQRKNSSSGGIFILLAEYIIHLGGYVFGACLSENCLSVNHIGTNHLDIVQNMMRSKYVQSEIGNSFQQARELLQQGKLVLFTGTPCQIAALKKFLKKEYSNLYTQDIVCHGVPSPVVWHDYIKEKEKKERSLIAQISFRAKTTGWKQYSVEYCFENGMKRRKFASDDLYMRCMMSNFSLRDSCFTCHFKGKFTQSDITLGDFWDIDKIAPKENDGMGCSIVLLQTPKGKHLFEQIQKRCHYFNVPYASLNLEQSMRFHSVPFNPEREDFLREAMNESGSIMTSMKRYCGESIRARAKKSIWRALKGIGVK